jgi:hypothetical protein
MRAGKQDEDERERAKNGLQPIKTGNHGAEVAGVALCSWVNNGLPISIIVYNIS